MPIFTPRKATFEDLKKTLMETLFQSELPPAPPEKVAEGGYAKNLLMGPVDIAKTVGRSVMDVSSMMNPFVMAAQIEKDKQEGVSVLDRTKRTIQQAAPAAALAVGPVSPIAALGVAMAPSAIQEAERAYTVPSKSLDEALIFKPASALKNTALELLGRQAFETAAQGKVRTGINPLTGDYEYRHASESERARAVFPLLMTALPAAQAFNKLRNAYRGTTKNAGPLADEPNATIDRTFTNRELNSGTLEKRLYEQAPKGKGVPGTNHLTIESLHDLGDDAGMPVEAFAELHGKITKDVVRLERAAELHKTKILETGEPPQITDTVRAVLAEIPDQDLGDFALKYNLNVPQTSEAIANYLRVAQSQVGQKSAVPSVTSAIITGKLFEKANAGDQAAGKALRSMGLLHDIGRGIAYDKVKNGTVSDKVKFVGTKAIDTTISLGISAPVTVSRNILSNAATEGIRAIAHGPMEKIVSSIYGAADDATTALGVRDAMLENLATAMQNLDDTTRNNLVNATRVQAGNEILGQLPKTSMRLGGINSNDIAGLVMKGSARVARNRTEAILDNLKQLGNRFKPETYGIKKGFTDLKTLDQFDKATDMASGVATALGQQSEMIARRHIFLQELENNAKVAGFKGLQEINSAIQSMDEIPAGLRESVARAETAALKNTYSYRYNDGLAGTVLDGYQKMGPLAKVLGPTFPRFFVNSWRLANDYSPANFMELMNPEFRAALKEGAKGGFKTKAAQQTLAQAATGSLLLSSMLMIRNSDIGGSKYYKINAPALGDVDLQQYPVISHFAFFADALSKKARGEPLDYTPNEMSSFLAGARRINDIMIFNLDEIFTAAAEGDAVTAGKEVGGGLSRFGSMLMAPLAAAKEMGGGLEQAIKGGTPSSLVMRDTSANRIVGPWLQKWPEFGDASQEDANSLMQLQPRVNIFDGKPDVVDAPFKRQFLGLNTPKVPRFQEYLERLPGIEPAELHHYYKDPRATHAVDTELGLKLSKPIGINPKTGKELNLADVIELTMENSNYTNDNKVYEIKRIFTELRNETRDEVKALHPQFFTQEEIANEDVPPSTKERLNAIMQQIEAARPR